MAGKSGVKFAPELTEKLLTDAEDEELRDSLVSLSAVSASSSNFPATPRRLMKQGTDRAIADRLLNEAGRAAHAQGVGRFDQSFGELSKNTQEGLDALFDATHTRLRAIYNSLESRAPREALNALVSQFSLTGQVHEDSLAKLANVVDFDGSGELSVDEFLAAASAIKMTALIASEGLGGGRLHSLDFDAHRLEPSLVVGDSARSDWLYTGAPSWAKNRWVHLRGEGEGAKQTLKLIGVKYSLHPLALEDSLNLEKQRSKVHAFDGQVFILFPCISVIEEEEEEEEATFISRLTTMAMAKPKAKPKAEKKAKAVKLDIHLVPIFLLTPARDVLISANFDSKASAAVEHVQSRLNRGYALMREGSCTLLLHRLLDSLVSGVEPCIEALDAACEDVVERIRSPQRREGISANVKDLQRESQKLLACVSPLPRVVANLRRLLVAVATQGQKNDMDGDVEALFTDLEDRTEMLIYKTKEVAKGADRLDDELRQSVDLETNRVLNTLTILSAVFIPGEFFSAVYGMNFDEMPELHWAYGYALFWVLVMACWVLFGMVYFCWRQ